MRFNFQGGVVGNVRMSCILVNILLSYISAILLPSPLIEFVIGLLLSA